MVDRVLITGGNGFIGKRLVNFLYYKKKISHIRIIDNLSTSNLNDLKKIQGFTVLKNTSDIDRKKKGIFFFKKNILNKSSVNLITKNIDVVIHLAANAGVEKSFSDPVFDLKNNILGTLNVLSASHLNNVSKVVIASSNAVVGKNDRAISEITQTNPSNFYGLSKLTAEHYARIFYETYNLKTICLRFGNVYGPGSVSKSSVIPKFIKNIILGKDCVINGDGNQTRDFIYVDDLILAIYKSIKDKKIGGEIFQISTGKKTSINKLTNIIKKNFYLFNIKNVNFKFTTVRKGDVKNNFSNIYKAKKLLKWSPNTNLNDGIRQTISYFINEKFY